MKRYLLDTNVISETRKSRPHGAVVAWMSSLKPEQVLVSAVTIGELQAGVEKTRRNDPQKAEELEQWVDWLTATQVILPMDTICFREWGRLMQGKSPNLVQDGMLAATARVHGLAIATRNESDFRNFGAELLNPFKTMEQ